MNVDNGPCIDSVFILQTILILGQILSFKIAREGPGYLYFTPISGVVFIAVFLFY